MVVGRTNPNTCFTEFDKMDLREGFELAPKVMILMSDGRPNIEHLSSTIDGVARVRKNGWTIYALGAFCVRVFNSFMLTKESVFS